MAANLRAKGETRTRCRCPICHSVVNLNSLTMHLGTQCGRKANTSDYGA